MELLNKIEMGIEKLFSFFIDYSLFMESQQKDFNEIVKDVIEKEI
jgi:hypothetical protein